MDEEAAGREIDRVATDIALASILRALIGEVFATDDRSEFRRRLAAFEANAVDSLPAEKFWENADDQANDLVKALAQGFITKVIASVRRATNDPS